MYSIVEASALADSQITVAHIGQAKTPVGVAWLIWDDVGIRELSFGACRPKSSSKRLVQDDRQASHWVADAFNANSLSVPLVLNGTAFQQTVWRALLTTQLGQTISYAQLAASVGQPSAARAVGGAVGANRLGFLVPCHRVVRQDGLIGQFRWGSEIKKQLLHWESDLQNG